MKTEILQHYQATPEGQEAEAILRTCVHCGFCTATCPTYQELNDERDGPRGRIYLIKQLLETDQVSDKTRTHLDRCLTCRSCETTCPSGVEYGRLVDIGRGLIEQKLQRPPSERLMRWGLRKILPYPARFGALLRAGQTFRPLLPDALKRKLPPKRQASPWPQQRHDRVMLALAGCAQSSAAPNTNAATARVLDRLGITLVEAPEAGCCGAVSYHLSAHEEGLDFMRSNIDAWWPAVEAGCEAIVMTASGCGAMVQEYGHLLCHDPAYADKAARISALTKDIGEILLAEDLSRLKTKAEGKIAVHCPCTLQHAMKQGGVVEQVLKKAGFELAQTRDNHLCCGSAGTYSILQPQMSQRLLENKLNALTGDHPDRIVTSNIGCQLHLETRAEVPVQHWIELLDAP
ncbi:glycolate oxidase iron-sulfur subunit [Marinobacterium zhoushanense]|uniref:Glycolate oxidase iron-sulfur subunit n=1 Tax=Marinobacterium zhoushanense TaxID=1679163 RepID=A0ABQ1KKQ6_9GAMM|nr:glycolate oxidase subunit GlcF [Marinobacterium zhoushanense]GGB98937.1 glycolate oxidase iron-sulfur subunit [Marinobacterium zhoushanense]